MHSTHRFLTEVTAHGRAAAKSERHHDDCALKKTLTYLSQAWPKHHPIFTISPSSRPALVNALIISDDSTHKQRWKHNQQKKAHVLKPWFRCFVCTGVSCRNLGHPRVREWYLEAYLYRLARMRFCLSACLLARLAASTVCACLLTAFPKFVSVFLVRRDLRLWWVEGREKGCVSGIGL